MTLESGLPEVVSDDENLARFLFSGRFYKAARVLSAAFMPNPNDHETSISRKDAEPAEELWRLAPAAAPGRSLHGAAVFKARVAREARLEVVADEPPPRHAVIRGWFWDEADPDLQRARQKEAAQVIASGSEFIPFPMSVSDLHFT